MVQQKLSGIEREAGQAALKAEELARRFGLTGEVPCAGTDLQGQCQLLGDARDAKALIPSAQGTIQRLGREKAAAQQELDALRGQAGGTRRCAAGLGLGRASGRVCPGAGVAVCAASGPGR
jgi:exonuclease SbcC